MAFWKQNFSDIGLVKGYNLKWDDVFNEGSPSGRMQKKFIAPHKFRTF